MDTVIHSSNKPVGYKVILYTRVDLDDVSTFSSNVQIVNVSTFRIDLISCGPDGKRVTSVFFVLFFLCVCVYDPKHRWIGVYTVCVGEKDKESYCFRITSYAILAKSHKTIGQLI